MERVGCGMIAKLLLLAKAAATSAVKSSRFIKEFSASDWKSGILSVSATEHGKGNSPSVDVWKLDENYYTKSEGYPSDGWSLSTDLNGNLTLEGQPFAGRIIIL